MLKFIPMLAIATVFIASLARGAVVKSSSGDRPWAFASARGAQRIAGLAFAASILVLALAAATLAVGTATTDTSAIIGATLSVLGTIVVVVAQVQMGRAWRVGVRDGDAPLFVRHGLFRFSRNPIFVGMILLGLGVAVASGAWWAWVSWIGFVLACRAQVGIEEAHLLRSFGSDYQAFSAMVPRWIGLRR